MNIQDEHQTEAFKLCLLSMSPCDLFLQPCRLSLGLPHLRFSTLYHGPQGNACLILEGTGGSLASNIHTPAVCWLPGSSDISWYSKASPSVKQDAGRLHWPEELLKNLPMLGDAILDQTFMQIKSSRTIILGSLF